MGRDRHAFTRWLDEHVFLKSNAAQARTADIGEVVDPVETGYTPDEMMTVAAARALDSSQRCFVGIGLPSAAANLARVTHAAVCIARGSGYSIIDGERFDWDEKDFLVVPSCAYEGIKMEYINLLTGGHVLAEFIRRGDWSFDAHNLHASTLPHIPLDSVKLLAPLPAPRKVVSASANYYEHVEEMHDDHTIMDWGGFIKAHSSVIGRTGTVQLPYVDKRTDHEGELAVVIGSTAQHVQAAEALDYVFGYACLLDITVRSTEDRSTRKSFDTFTPIGPWVTTADETVDPGVLELRCWVNGVLRQSSDTSRMIYSVPAPTSAR
ncbi:fumarylacetoacetate hydrolase family protein [Nocardia sp. NPDC052278]|uniref:fumarylacetoacetate hydrolase family protein n=1 Tax=unclassified Nocardia TaxID=2637762 RepID=UPI00368EBBDE